MNDYVIKTDPKIIRFIENHLMPGWYIDVTGCYCGIMDKYLFCIFVNSNTNELELTVSKSGDYNSISLEWETLENLTDSEIDLKIKELYEIYIDL